MTLLALRPRVNRSFAALYRRHVADVYHYALAVLRNPRAAEDVTEATFVKAYARYRHGERPHAPRTWLIALAHDGCRERSAPAPHCAADGADAEAALDDIASAHEVRWALGHLPFSQRLALELRDLEGRSYADIAATLTLTSSEAETLVFRARRTLRDRLDGLLTCAEAELAISRQMDGRLPRGERAALRAHVRGCPKCVAFARRQRTQRAALRSLASIPLPASLASFLGRPGSRLAARAAALVAIGALAGAVVYEAARRVPAREDAAAVVARAPSQPRTAEAARAERSARSHGRRALAKRHARQTQERHTLWRRPPSVRVGEK